VVLQERGQIQLLLETWKKELQQFQDAQALYELACEADDEGSLNEAADLIQKCKKGIGTLELNHMLCGEQDSNNAIMSINPGAGGTDSADWAEMLERMYLRWAEKRGFKVKILDHQPGEEAGIRSSTFILQGPYAYGFSKAEVGVHRLVRISPFDSNKRRHTSFASVFVTPELDDSVEVEIKEDELRVDTYRSSGAGGQHVNTTDSAVRITHIPTGIVVQCQNERSQHRNREAAMKVLKSRLYEKQREEQQAKLDELHSTKKENAWGNQIRSYVLHPYRMVKDHRTNFEMGDVDAVLDGDLDDFIEKFLIQSSNQKDPTG